MMCICVLHRLNTIIQIGNNVIMKKLFTSFYMLILFIPFILSDYFEWNVLYLSILFYGYQWMIIQYYSLNQKRIEMKDFIFSICFSLLSVLIYRLFGIRFNFNQIIFILLISTLCVVQVGCNHRIHVEIA